MTPAERYRIDAALIAAARAIAAGDTGGARHYAREASELAGDAWRAERDAAAAAADERRRAARLAREADGPDGPGSEDRR